MSIVRFFFLDRQKYLGLIFCCFFLLMLTFLLFFLLFLPKFPKNIPPTPSFSSPKELSFHSLEEGPFFLKNSSFTPQLPDLSKEFSISLYPDRPDRVGKKRGELLLYQTNEKKLFASEEKIFFSLQNGKMYFSQEPSGFWIEPSLEKEGVAVLKIGIEEEKTLGLQPLFFSKEMPTVEIVPSKVYPMEGEWLQKLTRAKWFGEDLFSFFSRKNLEEKKLQRVEIENISSLMKEGDWLSFKERRWQLLKEHKDTEKYPLAVVARANEQQMEIEVWEQGGKKEKILWNKQLPLPFKTNPEEWVTAFHLRPFSSLSLVLEKQHLFLRKGEWACRKSGHWKVVKNSSLLPTTLAEAFFFFEGIEEKNGQKWWKGHFINGTGTLDHRIEKPISPKKKRRLSDPMIIEREKEKKS